MSLVMFKLESFSNGTSERTAVAAFSQEELDRAYADGVADARAQAEDTELRALAAGLAKVADSMAYNDKLRSELRREAVDALAPILTQILDLMAPPLASRRLEEALREELARLAQRSQPMTTRIACSTRLRGLVERCLSDAGLEGIEIDAQPADRISVSLQGGRIEVDPMLISDNIRALIAEITQEDPTWTH